MSTPHDPAWETPSGRHPVNVGHLVMGVAFVGLVTIWALNVSGAVTGPGARFLFPLPWVAAGVAGLIASGVSTRQRAAERRREATRRAAWAEEQAQMAERWAMPDPTPTTPMPTGSNLGAAAPTVPAERDTAETTGTAETSTDQTKDEWR